MPVNMKSWGDFPNFSSANRVFPTREAAGLRIGDLHYAERDAKAPN